LIPGKHGGDRLLELGTVRLVYATSIDPEVLEPVLGGMSGTELNLGVTCGLGPNIPPASYPRK
jgi:hypothetical protein